jgi:hypothetical protein
VTCALVASEFARAPTIRHGHNEWWGTDWWELLFALLAAIRLVFPRYPASC